MRACGACMAAYRRAPARAVNSCTHFTAPFVLPGMKRMMLILLLAAPLAALAQETTTTAPTTTATTTTTAAPEATNAEEVRVAFESVLAHSPSEVATIFVLDPTLLSDEAFLVRYPEIARFVKEHPEVRHNPRFYLAEHQLAGQRRGSLDDFLQGLIIFSTFVGIALAFAWLVRTLVEQNRWNRLSRTQSEVHNKILDRFGTSAELMQYINTPAGSKFLESAPIPLHTERAPRNAPLSRALWSIQIGVIVAAAASGMLIVSGRFTDDTGQGLFALGVIALCVGGGFIASAAISLFLSRRLAPAQEA